MSVPNSRAIWNLVRSSTRRVSAKRAAISDKEVGSGFVSTRCPAPSGSLSDVRHRNQLHSSTFRARHVLHPFPFHRVPRPWCAISFAGRHRWVVGLGTGGGSQLPFPWSAGAGAGSCCAAAGLHRPGQQQSLSCVDFRSGWRVIPDTRLVSVRDNLLGPTIFLLSGFGDGIATITLNVSCPQVGPQRRITWGRCHHGLLEMQFMRPATCLGASTAPPRNHRPSKLAIGA
jgi:hypothetical protein